MFYRIRIPNIDVFGNLIHITFENAMQHTGVADLVIIETEWNGDITIYMNGRVERNENEETLIAIPATDPPEPALFKYVHSPQAALFGNVEFHDTYGELLLFKLHQMDNTVKFYIINPRPIQRAVGELFTLKTPISSIPGRGPANIVRKFLGVQPPKLAPPPKNGGYNKSHKKRRRTLRNKKRKHF